jgi:importin subunit beta-1
MYIKNLKESIIESYTGVVLGIKGSPVTSAIDPYVNDIFQYLNLLCPQEPTPSLDLAKSIAGLIGDFAEIYGAKAAQLLSLPFIERIIGMLEKSSAKDHRQLARWVRGFLIKILKPDNGKIQ